MTKKTNMQKKQDIDEVLEKYKAKMAVLKERRDKVVSDFNEVVRQRSIKEIEKKLKNL